MALIEKDIADDLVDLRLAMSTGTEYVKAADLEAALRRHLDREQHWRSVVAETAAVVGFAAKVEGAA